MMFKFECPMSGSLECICTLEQITSGVEWTRDAVDFGKGSPCCTFQLHSIGCNPATSASQHGRT